MEIKTTEQIYQDAFVKDRLFWIRETEDKEQICNMNNNPKNKVKWVRVDDVDTFIDCFCKNYKLNWDNGNPLSPNEIKSILSTWKNVNLS